MTTFIRSGLLIPLVLLGSSAGVGRTAPTYRLFFPTIPLEPNEQIEGFDLSVPCGHIVAITDIPWDWNVEVIRAVSEVEELHASAGHGISYVRQMDRFNGGVHIVPTDTTCFDVTATVTATFDTDRVVRLTRPALQLRR